MFTNINDFKKFINESSILKENMTSDSKADYLTAVEFTPDELSAIQNIVADFFVDMSGIVTFEKKYALIKFKSGIIQMLLYKGENFDQDNNKEYCDYQEYANFEDLTTALTSKSYEKAQNENFHDAIPHKLSAPTGNEFNIEGFKDNLEPYLNSDPQNYIDLDENENTYYINIPITALVTDSVDIANKIVRIAQKYPKCQSAFYETNKHEIRLVFNNF